MKCLNRSRVRFQIISFKKSFSRINAMKRLCWVLFLTEVLILLLVLMFVLVLILTMMVLVLVLMLQMNGEDDGMFLILRFM